MNDSSASVLRIPGRLSVHVIVGGLIAAVLWALVFAADLPEIRWLAIAFTLFALISLRHTTRPLNVRMDDGGIVIEKTEAAKNPDKSGGAGAADIYRTPESWTGQRIRFDELEAVLTMPRSRGVAGVPPDRHAAVIVHRQGDIFLPRNMPGRATWLNALRQKMTELDPVRGLSEELVAYHRQESATFGPGEILTARILSRLTPGGGATRGGFLDLMLASLGAAVVCGMLAGTWLGKTERAAAPFLAGFSVLVLFFMGLFWLSRRGVFKQLAGSGIVISPSGLALQYGKLKGVLDWHELQRFKLKKTGSFTALRLTVPGATILVGEFFDRPLSEVYRTLQVNAPQAGR